uniref:Uncharacterized protein n=1 Tax=Eutreptiella gymnastica TaxID=73025 RepID=A0A7S1NUK5_9EUGL
MRRRIESCRNDTRTRNMSIAPLTIGVCLKSDATADPSAEKVRGKCKKGGRVRGGRRSVKVKGPGGGRLQATPKTAATLAPRGPMCALRAMAPVHCSGPLAGMCRSERQLQNGSSSTPRAAGASRTPKTAVGPG